MASLGLVEEKASNLSLIVSLYRERATAHRTLRRQDKKMKELQSNIEDERKQAEVYKTDVCLFLMLKLLSPTFLAQD